MAKGKKNGVKPDFVVNERAVCVMIDVDNPYFNKAHAESATNSKKNRAGYNIMESPIGLMIAKGQVTQAEGQAGLHFRRIFETAGGTGAQAADWTRDFVDGGGPSDPLSERRWQAHEELREVRNLLGPSGYELVRDVCGLGQFMNDIFPTKYQQTLAGKHLHDCLTQMSRHWGYETARLRRWGSRARNTVHG